MWKRGDLYFAQKIVMLKLLRTTVPVGSTRMGLGRLCPGVSDAGMRVHDDAVPPCLAPWGGATIREALSCRVLDVCGPGL